MKILWIAFMPLFLACYQSKKDTIKGHPVKKDQYLASHQVANKDRELQFFLVNNPLKWNEDVHMILYLNYQVVYSDKFKSNGIIQMAPIKADELAHFKLEVIVKDKLFIYEDKSNFKWDDEYRYIYIGFFPDNPSTDFIHFFPQKSLII